jgi:transmembrane protein 18
MLAIAIHVSRPGRDLAPRLIVMLLIGALVKLSDRINAWAGDHYRDFATQNYFDSRGVFVATMLCAPLLLDSFLMLLCYLREASTLLVQLKKTQLQKKANSKKQQQLLPSESNKQVKAEDQSKKQK